MDSVLLFNEVTKMTREEVTSPPHEGVYVYGLYLEGAGWDRRNCKLTESQHKVLYVQMPVVHVYAINASDANKDNSKLYSCPLYKKPRRTDLTYISALFLKTALPPDHWTMRGVALLCDNK